MFSTKHKLIREAAGRPPHIRNMVPVISLVFDTLDQAGIAYTGFRSWQCAIGLDHVGKLKHPEPTRRWPTRITIERKDGTGTPLNFFTVDDVIAWRSNPQLP